MSALHNNEFLEMFYHGLVFSGDNCEEAIERKRFAKYLKNIDEGSTILMHCKPKTDIHLGNIWMLNKLKQFLSVGFTVVIAIISFDEEYENDTHKFINKLHDANNTKKFLLDFFGSHQRLIVETSQEMELNYDVINDYHQGWNELIHGTPIDDSGFTDNEILRFLIKQRGQFWASVQHTFVSKCLAVYDYFQPLITICGQKHRCTVASFKLLAMHCKKPFPDILYLEDLKDLNNEDDMDTTRSGIHKINISDSKNVLMHKLSLMENMTRAEWVTSAMQKCILASCEFVVINRKIYTLDRCKQILNIEGSQDLLVSIFVEALNKLSDSLFKSNDAEELNEALIPNIAIDTVGKIITREFNIRWAPNISPYGKKERKIVEYILKFLFIENETSEILIHKEFGAGFSGNRVFEIIIYDSEGKKQIDSKIVKVGNATSLLREKSNYHKYVKKGRTFAFVQAGKLSWQIDGLAGLVYDDAKRWLGVEVGEQIISLEDMCHERICKDSDGIIKIITNLVKNHLEKRFYRYGEFYDLRPYNEFYNNILPPDVKLDCDSIIGTTLLNENDTSNYNTISDKDLYEISFSSKPPDELIQIDKLIVKNINKTKLIAQNIRKNFKVEIGINEQLYRSLKKLLNKKINVRARIKDTRAGILKKNCENLPTYDNKNTLQIGNLRILNPLKIFNKLLNTVYPTALQSVIHGDLNLQNILVSNNNAVVIDYEFTGPNKLTVFDFVKLEVELRNKVLAKKVKYTDLIIIDQKFLIGTDENLPDVLENGFKIINCIRKIAADIIQSPNNVDYGFYDYYAGLYFYSLSSLKFKNLDANAKTIAFNTASLYGDMLAKKFKIEI